MISFHADNPMIVSRTYESVTGYFIHDDPEKLPLPAVPSRFGLNDDSDDRWPKFFECVRKLNDNSPPDISYKFILLSRHGQGYHNLAESKYGTKAWDDYWSKLNGDGEITWGPDPLLTPLGKAQARDIQSEWRTEASSGLSPPDTRYCSPLSRALDTCDIMFEDVYKEHPGPVLVVENCREENGAHTCDKRNSRSYIATYKPHFEIEKNLTEFDELWHPTIRETKPEIAARALKVLDMIFENDPQASFVSITAHGGFISGFLTAIGRERYTLPTGGTLPILVKAENRP
ncbi:hypothetical protein GALMADRAFT_224840 [Galerina marginata CBS 339.88]|uniref:Phosphoglycerate mutase-like protein n=1 Tax=Galerina marginata (strain CBS 339.88) TaxID=685588 RepID=A0A067T2X1_GALM3|nr:hypothetical protein GALMADRAFT_224840 [Galerina marginata CBS 339.88]